MKTRPIALILVLAILGFMLASATSCTISPSTQAKLDAASAKYEQKTGITPMQTAGLLTKWYADYEAAKAASSAPVAIPSK